jgi:hypothetical protein
MVFVPLTELRSVRASSLTRALLSWVSSSVPHLPVSLQPSSPGAQAHLRTAGANRPSRSVLVVSHHLNGLLRLQLRGLVASRYQHKVRRFSSIPARQLPNRSGQSVGAPRTPFQATLLTPFRVFPSPAAAPRHPPRTACFRAETPKCFNPSTSRLGGSPENFFYGRCPHDVPSRAPRCLSPSRCQDRFQPRFARERRLQGFAPLSSTLRCAFIADCAPLATPLGLVPLQGLPSLSLRARLRTCCFLRAVSPGAE